MEFGRVLSRLRRQMTREVLLCTLPLAANEQPGSPIQPAITRIEDRLTEPAAGALVNTFQICVDCGNPTDLVRLGGG